MELPSDPAAMSKKEKIEYMQANGDEAFLDKYKLKGQAKNLAKALKQPAVDKAFDELVNGPARAAAAAAEAARAAAEKAEADASAAAKLADERAARRALQLEEAAAKAAADERAARREDAQYGQRVTAERIARLRAEREEEMRRRAELGAEARSATQPAAEVGIARLPHEALAHVATFLPPTCRLAFGAACARLRAAVVLEPRLWEEIDMSALPAGAQQTDEALRTLAALAQGGLRALRATDCPRLSRGAVAGVALASITLRELRAVGVGDGTAWSVEQLETVRAGCASLRVLELDVWVERLTDAAAAQLLSEATAARADGAPAACANGAESDDCGGGALELLLAGLTVRNVDAADVGALHAVLGPSGALRALVLEGSSAHQLGPTGGATLAAAINRGGAGALTRLDCPRGYMLDEGVAALAGALGEARSLRTLALASNAVRAPAMEALASWLCAPSGGAAAERGCSLRTLDLRYNEVGAVGAPHVGTVLRGCASLTELDLRFNGIDNHGIVQLAAGLADNATLTRLDLTGNLCQIGGGEALGDALSRNRALTALELDSNRLTAKGAAAIAGGLMKNGTLRRLSVGGNGVKAGAKKFASALQVNSTLQHLELGSNGIDDDGCDELAWMLAANGTLTHLARAAARRGARARAAPEPAAARPRTRRARGRPASLTPPLPAPRAPDRRRALCLLPPPGSLAARRAGPVAERPDGRVLRGAGGRAALQRDAHVARHGDLPHRRRGRRAAGQRRPSARAAHAGHTDLPSARGRECARASAARRRGLLLSAPLPRHSPATGVGAARTQENTTLRSLDLTQNVMSPLFVTKRMHGPSLRARVRASFQRAPVDDDEGGEEAAAAGTD